jgi:PIN domain nuclease of toxin-antitoxin system
LRLLLDTHIWLWMIGDPEKIGAHLRRELGNAEELWLSPISTWETLVLARKGRIRMHEEVEAWIEHATAPFREAPLTHAIAMESQRLAVAHSDPADRFIAATAKVLGLTLATADTRLLGLGDVATIANR